MSILIFPSSLCASVKFALEARRWGKRTIGASSVPNDASTADYYDILEKLPFIGDSDFFDELKKIIAIHGIESLFTPHAATFHLLEKKLPLLVPGLRLIGDGPFQNQINKIKDSIDAGIKSREIATKYRRFESKQEIPLSAEFIGGLLTHVETIHGECSREKMHALFATIPFAPKGDIVEIGALFGKSSYLFNRIGAKCGIGATLVVDPWDLGHSIQHDAPTNIQDASSGWDWSLVATGFRMNLVSSCAPPFNYLRMTSEEAHERYVSREPIISEEFGATIYKGRIAVLHLDGNHDEIAVLQDFNLWSQHLLPNAWIIFDDYEWPHGDGPRKVADLATKKYFGRINDKFVAGGAMFMNIL